VIDKFQIISSCNYRPVPHSKTRTISQKIDFKKYIPPPDIKNTWQWKGVVVSFKVNSK
jgi:hypothetical protein